MTNDVLLTAAAQGDDEALLLLFDAYAGLMYKAARQPHLSCLFEDALAEARLSFLEAIQTYDKNRGIPFPGFAKAKVYGDLRTLFKRERRRWQRELPPMLQSGSEKNTGSFPDTRAVPTDDYEAMLQRESLRTVLTALPPRQQQLLHMLFFEERTQKEAAARLGISQQAAASMKARALKQLRRMFVF